MEISDLNLSVRTFNGVCRTGIKTIQELYDRYQMHPEGLRQNVGSKGMQEIGDALAKHREDVFAEIEESEGQNPELKPGDYLIEYDPEIWGDPVTFDELSKMEGCLVIVNDSWYPDDILEDDGEGTVMCVRSVIDDVATLNTDEPTDYKITRQAMNDSVSCRYCTRVWKLKESEDNNMNEDKTAVIVSEEYTKAVTLTRSIIANAQAAQQSLYEVCKGLKEMRDGKLYKELGYANFEDYTENEVGIKRRQAHNYIMIAENMSAENVQSIAQIGSTKLTMLAMLDEPTRKTVTETIDVESVTVKELKAQITSLTAERDKKEEQLQSKHNEWLRSCDANAKLHGEIADLGQKLDAAVEIADKLKKEKEELVDENDYLIEQYADAEKTIEQLQNAPVDHAVIEDTESKKALEQARKQMEEMQAEFTRKQAELEERIRNEYENKHDGSQEVTETKVIYNFLLENAKQAVLRLRTFGKENDICAADMQNINEMFEVLVDMIES